MMNKLLKGIKTVFFSLLIVILISQTAYASVNIQQLEGVINGLVTPQQVNEVKKPQLNDRNNTTELVDPMTGSLTLKQTDVTLPGKDGLDLSIARIYNSSQAEIGTKRVKVTSSSESWTESYSAYYADITTYDKINKRWGTKTVGPYSTSSQAVSVAESYLNDTSNPNIYYYSYRIYYNSQVIYYESYTVTTQNYPDKYNYLRSRYDIGNGWSLAFPSVQIEENNGSKELFFHDGTGATYRVRMTPDTTDSNLENYQGKDVQFLQDNASYSNGQVSSQYVFVNSDQRKTYFAADGRIIGVKDRFGNQIKFTHINRSIHGVNYPFISQIVDSIGRTIDFTYENTINTSESENIFIKVNDPAKSKNLSIKYNKQRIVVNRVDTGQTWYDVRLYSVTDPEGFETKYNYDFPETKFMYTTKNLSSSQAYTTLAWLKDVWYPHSKSTYNYEGPVLRNLGPDGAYQGYRVKSRYDQERRYDPNTGQASTSGDLNHIDYQYVNDYTGYPTYPWDEALPESYQFSSEATAAGTSLKSKAVFNGAKQKLRTETTASNGEKKIISHLAYDANYKFKPTRTEIAEYSSGGTSNKLYIDQTYNDWGGLSSETQPLTQEQLNNPSIKALYTTTYQYHPTYKFLTERKWYQNTSTLRTETTIFNDLGRILTATNPNGETTNYAYSNTSEGDQVTITKSLENGKTARTIMIYGTEAKLAFPTIIKEFYTDAGGSSKETKTTRTYNLLLGLPQTETDNDGKTTTYTYDNLARVTSIKLPNYSTVDSNSDKKTYEVEQKFEYDYATSAFFDATNKNLIGTGITSYTLYKDLATGTTNKYDELETFYDGFGNLRLQDLWDYQRGAWVIQSQYHYDDLTRPNYVVDAEGNSSTYAYNPWGGLYRTVDPLGNVYQTDYELIPRKQTSYFMANGTTTKQNVVETYLDQWGQVIQKKAFPSWPNTVGAISENYTYDIAGNILTHTDPNNGTTTYSYDKLDRLQQIRDPLNQVTEYGYTALGELRTIKQTDGTKSWVTSREYDELARLTKKIAPSSAAEPFAYNALGLLEQRKDLNQNTFHYTYDAHWREITKNGPTSSFAYTYYNPLGVSWIEQLSNSQLVRLQGFNYNPKGQIDYSVLYNEVYEHKTYFSYDKVGNLTGVQDPFSHTTLYGYNKNRLTRVQTNGSASSNTSDEVNAKYEYYPNGMLKSVTYPKLKDGSYLKTSYEYNDLNRLTKLTSTKGAQTLSQYAYSYDNNGNITGITDALGTTTYIYDKLDRLIEIQRPDGKITQYAYDVRGNRSTVKNDTWSINLENTDYAYNEWDQLTSVQTGTNAAAFQYGPTGLRTKKVTPTETTRYHYNNQGEVIAESDASNTLTANYVWGPDRVLVKKEPNGKEYYYLYNGHGDVSQIIDSDGNIVNEYRYDEWGNILSQTEQVKNPFKYAGEIYDAETGLYYLRARYYDPSIGRFINKDSYEGDIVNPLTFNLYAYCANNPLLYIDPSGHKYVYNRFGEIIGTNVGDDYTDYSQAATNTSGGGDRVYKPWNGGTGSSGTGSVNSSSSVTKSSSDISRYSSGKVAATLIGPLPDAKPELLLLFPGGNFANLIKGAGSAANTVANLGKSYGKFGTVVKNPGIKITDFSTHGVNQAITRGVTTNIIKRTIDNPTVVLSQRGGNAFAYVSRDAVVVVDKAGKIITTYGKNHFDTIVNQVLKEAMK
ncbi:YD repeat protein [Desulforamulus ruminis DSM 2154]|uniref:YD repeat protein n=2 Tax=Desulforamulus ruminis TaxID=1564 RepID=F6DT54_DESRL|nr:YD repeat protein [Desulforamulus ruminis DSM 2154]